MRVLFFNEGNLGGFILGQRQLESALRSGTATITSLEARFAGLAPMSRVSAALSSRPLPLLARYDLDFRDLRWHLVQSLRARRALARELRAWPADVVHLHTQSVALLSVGLMRKLPLALSVDTSIEDWAAMPAWAPSRNGALALAPSRALERRALGEAALVLAWTGWARHGVEREQPAANVVVHHPGIDLQHYRPASRAPRSRAQLLFVGGRFAQKGGEDLLRALGDKLGETVELDVVTRDEVQPRNGLRVHHLEASDPRLLELYQQADVLCLPTHGDTNPWVLLEAMACGTATLSTTVGAIPELLDGGNAGVLVEPGDVRALRAALDALLADPARRAELGARGRRRCEEHYDAARQVPALVERLRTLAAR